MKNQKTTKRRIRFDRILIFLLFICLIIGGIFLLFNIKISNIYIINNDFLTDQYIIEKAKLENYPSSLENSSFKIKAKLEEDDYIKSAKVYKKGLTKVYIEVEENKPLFYYEYNNKTVLEDGKEVDKKHPIATVVNYITDNHYNNFIKQMATLNRDVLNMISEIKFSPNEFDDNRFLLTMTDGNYVYVNLYSYKYKEDEKTSFEMLNMYLTLKKDMPLENGILYLDYGNNFEIIK